MFNSFYMFLKVKILKILVLNVDLIEIIEVNELTSRVLNSNFLCSENQVKSVYTGVRAVVYLLMF